MLQPYISNCMRLEHQSCTNLAGPEHHAPFEHASPERIKRERGRDPPRQRPYNPTEYRLSETASLLARRP